MALLEGPAADLADRLMDILVVPGFSAIGYRARRRMFGWQPPWLEGRSVMVTGANSGLGKATALELARCGAEVHMLCRSREKGERAREEIAARTGTDPKLHLADLSDLDSVRSFAEGFLESGDDVDVLINNAGVMTPERQTSPDGFDLAFATNVLGPFLLTESLLPRIAESDDGRVVTVSSGGMYSTGFDLGDPQLESRELSPSAVYAHTKRAEVMLAEEWADRWGEGGPASYSLHPGWASTPGVSDSLPGFDRVMGPVLRSAGEGADTAVWLCGASPESAPSGEFFSDRRVRPKHRIPGTADSRDDRRRLYDLCATLVGIDPD